MRLPLPPERSAKRGRRGNGPALPARAQPGGAPPGAGIRSAARQVYMNAVRGGPMDGLGKYSEEGNKLAAERLRELIDYHISKLSDEDKE